MPLLIFFGLSLLPLHSTPANSTFLSPTPYSNLRFLWLLVSGHRRLFLALLIWKIKFSSWEYRNNFWPCIFLHSKHIYWYSLIITVFYFILVTKIYSTLSDKVPCIQHCNTTSPSDCAVFLIMWHKCHVYNIPTHIPIRLLIFSS